LRPTDPIDAVVQATADYPLVGLAEPHLNEKFHGFLAELLPELPGRVDDIVVEFGNAYYQDVADRFILQQRSIDFDELAQIWRTTLGGRVYWDAPVYEQFFRSVAALNASLDPNERIRVLLGDAPVDWSQIDSADDQDKLPSEDEREPFFADLVEREVLDCDHRALLVIGGDHIRSGEYRGPGGLVPSRNPRQPNAGTLLADAHPGALYVVYPLQSSSTSTLTDYDRIAAAFANAPRPSLAVLDGTWLGNVPVTYRLLDPSKPEFGLQVDAVLWLGPDDELTESLPDAARTRNSRPERTADQHFVERTTGLEPATLTLAR
jgi:hypothetical protein